MNNQTDSVKSQEARDLEAWKIAQKIHIGEAIPKRDQSDLRSDLFFRYMQNRDYFARQANFAAAVCSSMSNDIKDAIKHLKTKQASFEAAMEPMISKDPETGKLIMADAEDEEASIEKFFGGLDREYRRELLKQWRKKFRAEFRGLPRKWQEFVRLLEKSTSQKEISVATGISRKGCFLRRKKLEQTFWWLLREHRNIKALEVK